MMTVKMVREMTSWMTFSCTSVKGPPLPMKPMRLAGTAKQYSMKAMLHEKAMTAIKGQWLLTPASCRRRWPYHAKVMKTLLASNRRMV